MAWWKRNIYRYAESRASKARQATIVLSKKERATTERLHLASPLQTHVIPNGVTSIAHDRGQARLWLTQHYDIPLDATVLGCVANFFPAKNLPALVSAFQAVTQNDPTLHLVLIGDGMERNAIETAKGSDTRVHLLGHQQQPRALMDGFDLFVLPSIKEGLPLALLEAMEAGLPCLATRVGGIPEIIEDQKNGWLTEPNTLAQGLAQALADRSRWINIGQAAHETVITKFSQQQMLQKTFAVYQSLIV